MGPHYEDIMGDSVKSLAEVEVDNIHCSPLIYSAGHPIIEGHQIGQAWFPLGESMLTTPDNLFFLHLFRDDIQNELFHHLSRDGGAFSVWGWEGCPIGGDEARP